VRNIDRLLVGSIGEIVTVLPAWVFLMDVPPGVLVAALFAAGVSNGVVNAPIWTIFTLRTPAALRAKCWAAIIASTALIGPVVLLGTGPSLESVGLNETLFVIVGGLTGSALLFTVAGLRERSRGTVDEMELAEAA
jgi:hypothetical protein